MKFRLRAMTALALAASLPLAYAAGMASAGEKTGFEASVNKGLVNAFNSVGQNLFGSEAFGATVRFGAPPDDGTPQAVQMDIVCQAPPEDDTPVAFQRIVNIVYPPDEVHPENGCRIGLQLVLDEVGVTAIVSPDVPEFMTISGVPSGEPFCDSDGGIHDDASDG